MSFLLFASAGQAFSWITDTNVHAPPTTGDYPYSPPGTWQPENAAFPNAGESYVDPVFGTTVRRLSETSPPAYPGDSDIYTRNCFWNADASKFAHFDGGSNVRAYNALTGATQVLPNNGFASRTNAAWDPADNDKYIFINGNSLVSRHVPTQVDTTLRNFGTALGELGGTHNPCDLTGRYWLVNLGAPSLRVWDRQTDTLYTGAITDSWSTSFVAMAPNADFVVHVNGASKKRYAINHGTQTLSTSGTQFYNAGGDHSAIIQASDGNLYYLRADNDVNPWILRRIKVSDGTIADIFTSPTGNAYWTSYSEHLTGCSQGPWQDWMFCATMMVTGASNDLDDLFTAPNPTATWDKMQSEIYAVNILTGAIRRIAHTRNREVYNNYNRMPRQTVSNSDNQNRVAFVSNAGYDSGNAYSDLYCVDLPNP